MAECVLGDLPYRWDGRETKGEWGEEGGGGGGGVTRSLHLSSHNVNNSRPLPSWPNAHSGPNRRGPCCEIGR